MEGLNLQRISLKIYCPLILLTVTNLTRLFPDDAKCHRLGDAYAINPGR
jgi:hypothetical protein